MKNEKPKKKSAPLFTLILITFLPPNQHIKHTFSDLA